MPAFITVSRSTHGGGKIGQFFFGASRTHFSVLHADINMSAEAVRRFSCSISHDELLDSSISSVMAIVKQMMQQLSPYECALANASMNAASFSAPSIGIAL